MLRAIIVDDEEAGVNTLRVLASRNPEQIRVVASSQVPEEGILLIEDYKPDIVFLDISMPTMNGFELLNRLSFRNFKLVFTTAHRDYAIDAIKNKAFDYLLKPINEEEFKKCITDILHEGPLPEMPAKPAPPHLIEVPAKDGINYIKQKDIVRLEASRSYTFFYLDDGTKHLASRSLREFEYRLDASIFYRCHHSHIINLYKVHKFINHDGFFALMSDGTRVDISKKNRDEFLERLKGI
jgi:two-component system, LytTR family, response regulator